MAKGKQPHPLTKPVYPTVKIVILSVLGVVVISSLLLLLEQQYTWFLARQPKLPVTYYMSPMPTEPPITPTTTPTPLPPVTFTSPDLGISFEYSSMDGKVNPAREVGNRIYVDPIPPDSTTGIYVEVDMKNPTDSIGEAITKQFLQGTSQDDCTVLSIKDPNVSVKEEASVPKNYVYAIIGLSDIKQLDQNTQRDHLSKCSANHPEFSYDGLRYFFMDTTHPDKLLYFNIGDSALPAGTPNPNISWNDTIHFTDSSN